MGVGDVDLVQLEKEHELRLMCHKCQWMGGFTALIVHLAEFHNVYKDRGSLNCFQCCACEAFFLSRMLVAAHKCVDNNHGYKLDYWMRRVQGIIHIHTHNLTDTFVSQKRLTHNLCLNCNCRNWTCQPHGQREANVLLGPMHHVPD